MKYLLILLLTIGCSEDKEDKSDVSNGAIAWDKIEVAHFKRECAYIGKCMGFKSETRYVYEEDISLNNAWTCIIHNNKPNLPERISNWLYTNTQNRLVLHCL